MFKSLVSIEKEFDYAEVANANPSWMKWVAAGIVVILFVAAYFIG
jgi:hypothetical protein